MSHLLPSVWVREPAELRTRLAQRLQPYIVLWPSAFEGPELAAFDHAVTTAYFWPVHMLSSHVERAGFVIDDVQSRTDPGTRPHGALVARRVP